MLRMLLNLGVLMVLVSCQGNKKDASEALLKASAYQTEGLKTYFSLQSQDLPDDARTTRLKSQLDELRNQMIDIPGIPHDHKYCNGQHNTASLEVTDDEMLAIQKEWRDSIITKYERLQNSL